MHESRHYGVRRPMAAFLGGAAVALLGGLIGLGGAEFRLPLLILVFALYPHRAVRINLLISLATLVTAAVGRLSYLGDTQVHAHVPEVVAMALAGVLAAWIGAGRLSRLPRQSIAPLIGVLLLGVAVLLVAESFLSAGDEPLVAGDVAVRVLVAGVAGLVVGAISSLLGVAGGEFIIPALIFLFGADIRTAGTASVLISIPIVLTGVGRHFLTGHYRSRSMLAWLALPMSLGSLAGALLGARLTALAPVLALRGILATILVASALKLWKESRAGRFS